MFALSQRGRIDAMEWAVTLIDMVRAHDWF